MTIMVDVAQLKSRESEIDRKVEKLIGKMVTTARIDSEDVASYQDLIDRRAKLMQRTRLNQTNAHYRRVA